MKTMLTLATILSLSAGSAVAGGFGGNFGEAALVQPAVSPLGVRLSFGFTETRLETIGAQYEVLSYDISGIRATVNARVEFNRSLETLSVGAEYVGSTTELVPGVTAYASIAADYVAPTTSLRDGDVFVTPLLGASYSLTNSLLAFSEVSYGWNASQNWASTGAVAEIGVEYAVNATFAIRPSLTHTFDTRDNRFAVEGIVRF
jgi:hypothetical protein